MDIAYRAGLLRKARAGLTPASWIAAGLVSAALVAAVIGTMTGFRALVVRSGSMEPTIRAGDLVVTRVVRPSAVHVGDIVTFRDPSRDQTLVTHRVQEVAATGATYEFVTKGDANTGVERWTVRADGSVGRLVARVRGLHPVLGWLLRPGIKAGLLIGGTLILGAVALHRIWAR